MKRGISATIIGALIIAASPIDPNQNTNTNPQANSYSRISVGSCTDLGAFACSANQTLILQCDYVSVSVLGLFPIRTCAQGSLCSLSDFVGCVPVPLSSTFSSSSASAVSPSLSATQTMQSLSAQTDSTTVKTTWILPTVTTEATTFNSANFSPSQAPQTNSATSPQTTTSALTATATKIITASATQTTTSRPELNEKNLIGYWGQDTVYFDSGKVQGSLLSYCQSNNWDYINLSFMSEFSGGSNNYQLNFANFGDYDTTAITSTSSEAMLSIGSDIMACQKLGVKIFLSLGGATGGYSVLAGTGSSFATLLYNSFFSGSSTLPRPFGQAVLDGIDWDIEANIGSQSDVITTNQKLKVLEPGIMISAVPQCPFPDAYVGEAVGNADAEFDFISVQFYNNFCALSSGSSSFNFNAWAAGISFPIAIALPGSPRSASNGLATITQITQAVDDIMLGENSKKFFGLTFWDISSVSAYKASGDNSFFVDEARSLINGL